ncbi:MAG: hypothetical protein U0640_08190 [Phycisphaerales bacterium]
MNRTCGWLSVASVSVGVLVCARAVVGQPLTYRVVEVPQIEVPPGMGYSYADVFTNAAIFNYGGGNTDQTVILRSNGVVNLQPLSGHWFSHVNDANSRNDYVGFSMDGLGSETSTIWFDGVPISTNDWAGRTAYVSTVNEHRVFGGQVVNEQGHWTAAKFDAFGRVVLLPVPTDSLLSVVHQVNNNGDAFGIIQTASQGQQLVRWRNGILETLDAPASSNEVEPVYIMGAINASGDVTAEFWLYQEGIPETIGLYLWRGNVPILLSQGPGAFSSGIADHGGVAIIDAMGQSSLWFEGQYYTPSQFDLLDFDGVATDILRLGSDGSMVARVEDAQGERIAILTLVPSPGSLVLVVAGLGAVARRRRGN